MKSVLEKTNRINLLFDFYQPLLTERQQTFMKHYYHDDYSLGEIAANFEISRQAVYEHIKRAEQTLEEYEQQLHLLKLHEQRRGIVEQIEQELEIIEKQKIEEVDTLRDLIQALKNLDR